MSGFKLTSHQIQELKAVHRSLLNKRNAYRINVIILLGTGWTYKEIAEALLLNAQSTIRLFKKIEQKHPLDNKIYIIADNARYYRSVLVKEYLNDSKIEIVYLPPYSPNLNLIERLWLFYKKKLLYNKYYETFSELRNTTVKFFRYASKHKKELSTLLSENFEIIGA